jgi:hypothetical protein
VAKGTYSAVVGLNGTVGHVRLGFTVDANAHCALDVLGIRT